VKFDEQFVLELTVRFELSIVKNGLSWALQASAGSSESLNVSFFNPAPRSRGWLAARGPML
jgi:hypothetical protein